MKAEIITPKFLFQRDVRYLIPTFQRPYVWNQDDQWEPLWDDVRNTAEQYLEELESLGVDKEVAAEERAASHFLGAIVLQQEATAIIDLEARRVIDGQQRLATLQLLLDATQEVFERRGFAKESRQLAKLVLNDPYYAEGNPDNIFKIWPTLVDREAFRHAMSNELPVAGFEDSLIVQAHEFFKLQIRQWLGDDAGLAGQRAQALATTLMGLLLIVVIDLQSTDNANIIFETLNARGTPLLASDLIKNSILHTAQESGLKSDTVYKESWQGFDQTWWRSEVRQGRLVRPRIDVYLHYWLTMRTAEEVPSDEVFRKFRDYSAQRPITEVVADIKTISESFRRLEDTSGWSPEGTFLYRWHVMDAGVTTPVILWLFSNRDQIGEGRFHQALEVIESYLVRRMVCRMTTKDYNRLFLELVGELDNNGPTVAAELVLKFLSNQTADSRIWPTDSQVREAFISLPVYQLLTRGRLRMILEGIEDALRSPKSEEEHVLRNVLTIEHIMPQAWRDHWPPPDGYSEEAVGERDRLVQTIGNLTLVNEKLNPALSNAAWASKREGLAQHSVLHLNKDVVQGTVANWGEAYIRERGNRLAMLAAKIWPRPAS